MGLAGCGCDCKKFRINICMKAIYIIPKARCLETKETVTHMELSGQRFEHHQRALCQQLADGLAEKLAARTKLTWLGFVDTVQLDARA